MNTPEHEVFLQALREYRFFKDSAKGKVKTKGYLAWRDKLAAIACDAAIECFKEATK